MVCINCGDWRKKYLNLSNAEYSNIICPFSNIYIYMYMVLRKKLTTKQQIIENYQIVDFVS